MVGDVIFHESFVGGFSFATIAEDADVFVSELGDFHDVDVINEYVYEYVYEYVMDLLL